MSDDLSQFSMFELFKAEAQSHAAALSKGLLAIESNPRDLSRIEPLMRAAHSVKGAASIIGLDDVVTLCHAMEDCFVAVQKGEEVLSSRRVDQLLQGVDMLDQIARLSEQQAPDWLESNGAQFNQLADALRAPPPPDSPAPARPVETAPRAKPTEERSDRAVFDTPADAPPSPTIEEPQHAAQVASAAQEEFDPAQGDRTVPVNARNLNRMMRLASESMIESRRFQSMDDSLSVVCEAQRKIVSAVDRMASKGATRSLAASGLEEVRELGRKSEQLIQAHVARLQRVSWRAEELSTALYHEVIASRMRPFSEGTTAFPRLIRDLARSLGKQVSLEIVGGAVAVDRDILRKLEAPLNHILRNCVDHGVELPEERLAAGKPEAARVLIEARHHAGMLTVQVRDDGRGIDAELLRRKVVAAKLTDKSMAEKLNNAELMEFLFLPGFSTATQVSEVSGRGVGLDVVRSMVQEVSGTVKVESEPGKLTVFTLHLPVTLSVVRAALAEVGGQPFAFPLSRLVRIVQLPVEEIRPVQGKQQFLLDEESVGLVSAAEILGMSVAPTSHETINVIVIGQGGSLCGLVVDRFIGELDIVVRPLDRRLGEVPHISSAAIMESGEPLLIVDIDDLFQSMQQMLGEGTLRGMSSVGSAETAGSIPKVLVVDDSITVREVERHLLASHGYDVDVAVDGQDGWNALCANQYDLLITDVDMPRMNGIDLIRAVRQDRRYADLPIIIVSYKDREEDRMLGLEVGASAYLTKGSFHDESLVTLVADFVGRAS